MAKNEFRRQESLSEDLKRWQNSLILNQETYNAQFVAIIDIVQNLIVNHDSGTYEKVQHMESSISELRDTIFAVEGTIIEIGSIEEDLLDLKIPTDSIIDLLRLMNKTTRKIEYSTEETLKLIIKSKRATNKDLVREDLDNTSDKVKNHLKIAKNILNQISDSLNPTLLGLKKLEQSSKEMLQKKIM